MDNPYDEASAILADADRLGIELRAEGDRLRFRPRAAMTAALARRLMLHKAILLAALNHRPASGRTYSVEAEVA